MVNVHRLLHLPELQQPSTGLDMCIGPDQGTVQRHMAPLLNVMRSPGHELASPYGIEPTQGPSMLHRHGEAPLGVQGVQKRASRMYT